MKTAMALGVVVLALTGRAMRAQEATASYEAVVKDLIAATERVADVLAAIKDGASADAARPDLKKAAAEFAEVRKKAEGLPEPDQQQRERIIKEYGKKLATAVNRFLEERGRVAAIAGSRDALGELAAMEPALPHKKKQ